MRGTSVRQALRSLGRRPIYTVTAVLTLAVGIGATTAIGTVADAVLVDGLPIDDPGRVHLVWGHLPQVDLGVDEFQVGGVQHRYLREQARTTESVAAFRPERVNLGSEDAVVRVEGARVSAPFFRTLGVALARGRTFRVEEEVEGSDRVVILSDHLWRERFLADADVLGATLAVNGVPHEVVGVAAPRVDFPRGAELPSHLRFPDRTDLWLPLVHRERGPSLLLLLARTRPGLAPGALQEDLDATTARIGEDVPGYGPWAGMREAPLQEKALGPVRPAVGAVLAGVVLVLLLACVNVASMLLTRMHARSDEMAVRTAMGARRRDLAAVVGVEALLLGAGAGAVGLVLAWTALDAVERLLAPQLPAVRGLTLEPATLAGALAVTLGAAAAVGLIPLLALRGAGLHGALRRARGRRSLGALATLQVAVCCTLLVGTGLLTRSLMETLRQDVGFDPDGLATVALTLPELSYPDLESRVRYHQAALTALADVSGVVEASVATPLPMSGSQEATTIAVEGRAYTSEETPVVEYSLVSPSFFGALGIERVAGRLLDDDDRRGDAMVGVVNRSMAEVLWPGQDPLGRRIKVSGEAAPWGWVEVVGVVEDIRRVSLTTAATPEIYLPFAQSPYPSPPMLDVQYVVRTRTGAGLGHQAFREALATVDPGVAPGALVPMEDLIARTYARSRALTVVLLVLGAAALGVAVVGLYGAVAFSVEGRRREMGVRLALGAEPSAVARRVVRGGVATAALGVVLGLGAAALVTRFLGSLLFQVSPLDPMTFAGVGALLLLTAAGASSSPALRAAREDPATVLREGER